MLGIHTRSAVRILEVEAKPLLDTEPAQRRRTCREIHEQAEIQRKRSRENRVAAEKIDLDLHRVSEPAKDIDVVPALFVIAARRIVLDPNLVERVPVQIRIF